MMTVEIRELIIRATIDDGVKSSGTKENQQQTQVDSDYDAIVDECVQQVLKILRSNSDR